MAAELLDDESQLPGHEAEVISDLPPSEEVPPEELVAQLEGTSLETPPTTEDDLPEKYRGKSIKEVVSMHQEAEKVIGRHSGEVGELRQYVDGFIKAKLEEPVVQAAPEEEPDFFEDPKAAVSKAIETHPDVVAAKTQSQNFRNQTALSQIKEKHPDMQNVLNSEGFVNWVKGSPIRVELFQRADRNFDFDCADELITQYKERTAATQEVVKEGVQNRQTAVKAASTGSATGASTAGSKRMFRRADIIKLMKTDPDRYDKLSGEILQAYRDGRVR